MSDRAKAYFQRHSVAAPPVSTLEAKEKPQRNLLGCAFIFAGLFWIVVVISILVYFKTRHQ